jgi:hypothetical protein
MAVKLLHRVWSKGTATLTAKCGLFPGNKAAGTWRWPPTLSSAEVQEIEELYVHPALWAFMAFSRVKFYVSLWTLAVLIPRGLVSVCVFILCLLRIMSVLFWYFETSCNFTFNYKYPWICFTLRFRTILSLYSSGNSYYKTTHWKSTCDVLPRSELATGIKHRILCWWP